MRLLNLFFAAVLFFTTTAASAEFVFTKSGQIYEGKIVEDKARSIVVALKEGKRVDVKRDDILRINYTQMYTGKYSIMKTNEEVFDAYIVAEDQSTVTLRKEWEKPEEFTLNRDYLLFMTKKNPTSVMCKVEEDKVKVNWNPPYMKVDYYNIYFREPGGTYVKAGTSSGKNFTMPELKKDTLYEIQVTAVDNTGYESLPSKDVRIYTSPLKLIYDMEYTDSGDKYSLIMNWEPLNYKGTSIAKYDIYIKTKDVFKQIGTTEENTFTVTGLNSEEMNLVEIRPIIGKGEFLEGNNVEIPMLFYNEQMVITARGMWLQPIGDFKKVTEPGFGALADFSLQNYFLKRLSVGIQCGYYIFPGIKGEPFVNEDIKGYTMLPAMLSLRYGVSPLRSLYISAGASGGYSFNSIRYNKQFFESGSFVTREVKDSAFEPVFSGGLQIQWQFGKSMLLQIGSDYNLIIENKVNYSFISYYASVGYGF